jgi:hypothetical protein
MRLRCVTGTCLLLGSIALMAPRKALSQCFVCQSNFRCGEGNRLDCEEIEGGCISFGRCPGGSAPVSYTRMRKTSTGGDIASSLSSSRARNIRTAR